MDKLVIDRTYQRDVDRRHAQRILSDFRWVYFQAITVTPIAGGLFEVLDGQHRALAARSRGDLTEVPCVIVETSGAQERAKSFVALNGRNKGITGSEMHFAAIAAGNVQQIALAAMLNRVGVEIVNGHAWLLHGNKPRTCAVTSLSRGILRSGEPAVEKALRAMIAAWHPKYKGFLVTQLFEPLISVELDQESMTVSLRHFAPDKLAIAARIKALDEHIKRSEALRQIVIEQSTNPKRKVI